MNDTLAPPGPDLIDQIPDPDTISAWLAEAVRRTDLLRSLLRLARLKLAYRRPARQKRGERCTA